LFLVSLLLLFLELACIRWFPAHVLFLTFFTNTVLLACFLGMSVGCLAARSKRDFLPWTPALLGLALAAAFGVERLMAYGGMNFLDVGHQDSPQLVFFGAEYHTRDLATFRIPVEVVNGFFFLIIALTFVGPGQELGRALARIPNRVQAYTVNILGSILGIALFAGLSALQLPPFWWFLPAALGLAYFLVRLPGRGQRLVQWAGRPLLLLLIPLLASNHTGTVTVYDGQGNAVGQRGFFWSPYYRIDYDGPPSRSIQVNLIGHQQMISREAANTPAHAYALPHALNRDAGGQPFEDVLVIGAGSGNDVSRALQWGAHHVDAVEIDPVIYRLGRDEHPDRPYDDPRVTVHLDDGRNFLRATDRKYDLVVYALVDSLVLHSSYSNIRLESYLFTEQAFRDVRRCLKPGGVFMMYNFFRQGWIVARLDQALHEAFESEPLVLALPYQPQIAPEQNLRGSFTLFVSGDTDRLARAFARSPEYWLRNVAPNPDPARCPNGFEARPAAGEEQAWSRFGLAQVVPPADALRSPTDDWPFLYLRGPMVPSLTQRGILLMGAIGLILIYLFRPRGAGAGGGAADAARMFFLGAGFMLVETKAVVHMALLFGGTWVVNSVVFFAVLVMILLANLFVLKCRPQKLWPYYVGLLATLALNVIVPLDSFLGMGRLAQVACSCLLVFAPILFAGVIFAVSFARTGSPDRAFGWNIAGAMVGGLAENTSMLLGFQYLLLVAVAFYACSLLGAVGRRPTPTLPPEEPVPPTRPPAKAPVAIG
jgi:SAM-dependent methyltransferase